MKKYILLVSILLLTLSASAQRQWTLRECVDYAVENNIEIKQEALKVKQAEVNVSTSKNSRLPDLNASADQRFSFGRSELSSGLKESANSSSSTFGLTTSMPLFTGFRIPNEIKRDQLDLLASLEGLAKVKDNMSIRIANLYLEILFKKEILKVNEEQVEQTLEQVTKTEYLVEAGKVPRSQLYDIKAQQAKEELSVTETQNALSIALLDLKQALNLMGESDFDIATPSLGDVIGDNLSSILPPSQIYQQSLTIKPHVKEYEYRLESDKRNLKIAQSAYYPTLSLGMGYNTQYRHMNGGIPYSKKVGVDANGDNLYEIGRMKNDRFSKQLRDNAGQYIGIQLNIPIFNRFATRNKVRSAKIQISSRELDLDNVKLALYKEIEQAYQSALAAKAKYESTEKAYDAANESYDYAKERYAIGKSTVFEFNEAKFKLLSSQSQQIQSKYDFLFRAKILDFYRGVEIDIR